MSLPKRILIVGGTHGNEWTGVTIVTRYQEYFKKKFPNLKLEFILANPEAHKLNKRFKDEDLNRAFQYLNENRPSYENQRAREIRQLIQQEECLVIDLHTTTANMGSTLIVSDYNPLNLFLCSKLTQKFPDCRVIGAPDPHQKYLASQSKFGLIIEVGPVANGVVAGVPLESSLALLSFILEVMDETKNVSAASVDIYEEAQDVYYPLDEKGELNGYIHSGFQGKDFVAMRGEITPFQLWNGQDVKLKIEENLYPIFINEAAYYPTKLAFTLCRKKQMSF